MMGTGGFRFPIVRNCEEEGFLRSTRVPLTPSQGTLFCLHCRLRCYITGFPLCFASLRYNGESQFNGDLRRKGDPQFGHLVCYLVFCRGVVCGSF